MKYIITESQYNLLLEEDKEQKVLELPGLDYFGSWDILQKFLERRGNPLFSIDGDLDLRKSDIRSLGNLVSVSGNLDLTHSSIKSLGNLESVGGHLYLRNTPISKMYSEDEIREMIDVGDEIYI